MTVTMETTDTYGDEANYAWVKRITAELPDNLSNRAVVRRMKALEGSTAYKHDTTVYDDTIQLDYRGMCVRSFITFE